LSIISRSRVEDKPAGEIASPLESNKPRSKTVPDGSKDDEGHISTGSSYWRGMPYSRCARGGVTPPYWIVLIIDVELLD
jgi:hypothetical protein